MELGWSKWLLVVGAFATILLVAAKLIAWPALPTWAVFAPVVGVPVVLIALVAVAYLVADWR